MSMFTAAKNAVEKGKRLRGQRLFDADELLAIAEAWEEAFLGAGLTEDLVEQAVKRLAESGESITASSIIKAARTLLPAETMSTSRDTDEQDRRYYRSVFDWARRTRHCPRSWINWTPDMEEHARSLGVMSEWTAPLMDWEKAETIRNSLFRLHGSTTENNQ